jgi:glycyl-tRNA synthetase beta chain
MSTSLLVELFTEELPPKALKRLGEAFGDGILNGLIKAQLKTPDPKKSAFATPRRLAVLIPDVLSKAPDRGESKKLMPSKVAFGADGKPSAALLKRIEKEGASVDQLERKLEGDAEYVFLNQKISGLTLAAGLQLALEDTIENLPIPKVMSYQLADGQTTVQFVRPVHGLMALHGDKVVEVSALGLKAGRITHGHRFQGVRDISVATAEAYEEALAAHGKVMASLDARRSEIDKQLRERAAALKGSLGPEEDVAPLLDEVTALVEYPTVYVGEFEREFLAVPQECLVLTMRTNQKYFPLFDKDGKLTNKFLIVSNMDLKDPKNIVEGNQRVVRPRLADARFFFETDKKTTLAGRVPQLASVVYHNKLGSQLDRAERVRKLAATIAGLIGADAKLADRAAFLAKADLVTSMVGEFPELQGIMGRYYALADGEDSLVAEAIGDQYRIRFDEHESPSNLVSMSLFIADRVETLTGFWGIGLQPTGDKDPFGLRRAALGVISAFELLGATANLQGKQLIPGLEELIEQAAALFKQGPSIGNVGPAIIEFVYERYRNQLAISFDRKVIDAVITLRPPLHEVVSRVQAVTKFGTLPEAASLAAANKRIGNILDKSPPPSGDLFSEQKLVDGAEISLYKAYKKVDRISGKYLAENRLAEALVALAELKQPVDEFFKNVMVNVEDVGLRNNRLLLLTHLRSVMNQVADISKLAVEK